jgi:hypothetical protein
LAVRRHQWAKKRTQDSVGSRQNSTARKWLIRRGIRVLLVTLHFRSRQFVS